MFLRTMFVFGALSAFALPASADLDVQFIEGAPKDRFVFHNTGQCPLPPSSVIVDLQSSMGGLVFDTEVDGPGANVWQPFELAEGAHAAIAATVVIDGARSLQVDLTGLAPGERFAFTIDVDDTLVAGPMGQTMVSGTEIQGAVVRVHHIEAAIQSDREGIFGPTAQATVLLGDCLAS